VNTRKFNGGIEVQDVDGGLLVRQNNEAYVARNWSLSQSTCELIDAALKSGLGFMIREDHPRKNARWPNNRGVVYLAFSPSQTGQWSFAVDTYLPARRDYGSAVFNGKYQAQFVRTGIPFTFEGRNKGAGHLVVARDLVLDTIARLASFDHSVLALNRKIHSGEGFSTEYVLQREILSSWSKTPWSQRYDVVQDEFPVDGGLTSRRIDILARDRSNGNWLIIELKRAEASLAAVRQVTSYLLALSRRDDFAHHQLKGVLVAERVSDIVISAAEEEDVDVYEIHWPLTFHKR